jgi:prepilin-type N-terminal cleavage/methylation domain-containing protein
MEGVQTELGFTLAEVLIVISLMSILALIGVSSMPDLQESQRRGLARHILENEIASTKALGAAEGGRAILVFDASGNSYTVGLDYPPYSATAASDVVRFARNLPPGVTGISNQAIIFDSRGFLIDVSGDLTNTTVSLWDQSGNFAAGTIYPTGYVAY